MNRQTENTTFFSQMSDDEFLDFLNNAGIGYEHVEEIGEVVLYDDSEVYVDSHRPQFTILLVCAYNDVN